MSYTHVHQSIYHRLLRNVVTCIQCGKALLNLDLKDHAKRAHRGYKGWKSFSTILAEKTSKQVPKTRKVKTCELCTFRCNVDWKLEWHILSVHQEDILKKKAYVCETCGEEFGTITAREGHVNEVHLNDPKFKCHFCPKSFFAISK